MQDAIILGGGISGLTAGYLAQQAGLDVSVIEKASTPGGPISSVQKDGYLVERGPNSLLLPDPWVETFIDELGLGSDLLETNPTANKRYIVKSGKLHAVPANPIQAALTPLFSLRGKLGFLLEPFRKQISKRAGETETVAAFVERRLGRDFLDYAIDPFVSGVYAGDPRQLILEHAFPIMRRLEREGGSLIRGAIKLKRQRQREGTAYKKRSVSFRRGLGVLPQTLAKKLGNRLWLNSNVVAVNHTDGGWQVTWKREGENFDAFAKDLIVCLPSYAMKRIAWSAPISDALRSTPDLTFPSVHSLALGFDSSQVAHPLDGFGMLIPSKEPHNILGALFSSSLYPERAPDGKCLLTVMIGGIRHRRLASLEQAKLLQLASQDLRGLLGISGEPEFVHLTTWPRAIPQYTLEFGPWKQTLSALEEEFSGLHFGGNCVDGIAMGASILSGKRLSDRLLHGDA